MKKRIYLQQSDFDVRGNDYISNYSSNTNCPLARACKRHFKTENVFVSACDDGVDIDGEPWSNTNEWNCDIAISVGECLHNGDDTHYYVTLTKE
jgi:hypothetical protein